MKNGLAKERSNDMKIEIRNTKDFYSGLIFLSFGFLAILIARYYPMGSAARMGPGYFPSLVGGVLSALGFIIMGRALWIRGEQMKSWALRPLLFVLVAVLAFAFLIRPFGLVLAILALVTVSCLGSWEFRLREAVALFLLLAAMAIGVFIYGLGLPFNVWPA